MNFLKVGFSHVVVMPAATDRMAINHNLWRSDFSGLSQISPGGLPIFVNLRFYWKISAALPKAPIVKKNNGVSQFMKLKRLTHIGTDAYVQAIASGETSVAISCANRRFMNWRANPIDHFSTMSPRSQTPKAPRSLPQSSNPASFLKSCCQSCPWCPLTRYAKDTYHWFVTLINRVPYTRWTNDDSRNRSFFGPRPTTTDVRRLSYLQRRGWYPLWIGEWRINPDEPWHYKAWQSDWVYPWWTERPN